MVFYIIYVYHICFLCMDVRTMLEPRLKIFCITDCCGAVVLILFHVNMILY